MLLRPVVGVVLMLLLGVHAADAASVHFWDMNAGGQGDVAARRRAEALLLLPSMLEALWERVHSANEVVCIKSACFRAYSMPIILLLT